MNFLGHESGPIRNAARSCIEALIRVCITDTLIEKNLKNEKSLGKKSYKDLLSELINVLTTLIENLDAWSAPTEELANVIEALIGRLRDRSDTGVTAATVLLKHLIKPLGLQRERTGIESVIGKFSSICGPQVIFEILPIDLLEENPKQTDSNSWLIALLNKPGYIINTYLQDFSDRFLTLSEKLFERRKISLENKELIESKTCETLISQIWSLLPGYCDLPRDLPTAFTTRFAELLAQLLYTQPSLRSSILKSLRNLADRNLSLSKPVPKAADLQLIRTFSISSSQALKNVEILASSSSNMVKVLINLLSRKEEMETTRAMVIECVRSWIALLSDQDFEQITTTITTALQAHAATPSTSEAVISKLQTMLDTYALLVSRLPAHQALELVSSDALLCGPAQKKAYRILASATPSLPSTIAERLLERVIEIGEDPKRIIGGAKAIGPSRLDLIAGVMAEVVLGCKESNKETRERAYELLVDMGRRMLEQGGTIDRRRVSKQDDEEIIEGENEVVQASIDEYLTIVSAGLAGKTPQMISATIMALSRVLFEFHKNLKEESISGLLNLILIFLSESKNREIIKAAIGFAKVSVVTLPQSIIEGQLEDLVKGLMSWADEHRNEIKKNVRHLFERLVRKFGDSKIAGCLNENDEGGKKLVNSIRKCQNREKKRKEEVKKKIGAGTDAGVDGEMELDEERKVGLKSSLGDAYEQALYGSDMSDEEVERQLITKHGRSGGVIEEEEEEVVDLLDPTRITKRAIAGKLAKVEQRREALAAQAAKYKRDSDTGKMMIDDEEEDENKKNSKKFSSKNKAGAEEDELSGMNAYLEAVYGEDGQTRDERGRVKFNKPTKAAAKRSREALEEETLKELEGLEVSSSKEPKKKARKAKEKLGAEFKAKKAGGDMTKTKGVSPYAYLPLSNISGKKNRAGGSSKIDITGKKRGSRK
ncbi:hypothetical protein CROQUDRAFT_42441 [Cronartium quercuum f. sp. fusiforme G11]|uniref:RRP12 HEAT domain-containing protein n=1 Tax=Cronartium quercuum f. sp. fusiforme G11 TaxID=708437 RepID=A0A9P6NQI9_9BASI|nr:hypothetical protein CROQUDRAFT_42441 [Cronartium quercuum f. sp. fusiforme G11]